MGVIGYARVSTTDQNPQLQLDALEEAGATRIFTDHGVSGATPPTPSRRLPRPSPRGDVLTVWKLDRLGRNTQHVSLSSTPHVSRDRIPQPHRRPAHRRADGQGDDHHHGRLRPTRTRHHDRANPRRAGRCRGQWAQGRTPRKVDDADAAKARQLRDKGIAASDIAKCWESPAPPCTATCRRCCCVRAPVWSLRACWESLQAAVEACCHGLRPGSH